MTEIRSGWVMADLKAVPANGIKVMSTFACGGGSSLGYKRAGCEVIAANDIDPEMAWHYKLNLNPRYYFLCPIRDLLTASLPDELFNLDILDGSPPCSTFSTAGSREKDWGKEKHFREGQATQILSDLFFDYLDVVEYLRPKVAIAENVKGMLLGNARGYVKLIMSRFRQIGYRPQLFLLNSADCGVPQRRERVFFCAIRDDLKAQSLTLAPAHRWISVKEATVDLGPLSDPELEDTRPRKTDIQWWPRTKPGTSYKHAVEAARGKESLFQHYRLDAKQPSPTLTANGHILLHWAECRKMTFREWKRLGSFPDDYQARDFRIGKYMVGMSVPPKLTEFVARSVCRQWLGVVHEKEQGRSPAEIIAG